jgi:hypothetical protein
MATIYPTHKNKYCGSLRTNRSNTWTVGIVYSDVKIYKNFATEALGFEFLKAKNIEHGLPIKNIITTHDDYYSVELTQAKAMKFDECDLELVQQHILYCNSGYTNTMIGDRGNRFHNLIMIHTPGALTVDHINHDPLDNRRANLRIADQRLQCTNQVIQRNNTSGIKGVSKMNGAYPKWLARWNDENFERKSKCFSVIKYGDSEAKQMAIAYRAEIISTLAHYD